MLIVGNWKMFRGPDPVALGGLDAVVCPPFIPSGGVVTDPGLYGAFGPDPPDTAGDFYWLSFNNGDNAGHLHWIVGAGRGIASLFHIFLG